MPLEIGHVEAIFRYPVKSMRGERLEVAELGWHGIEGDRRMAFDGLMIAAGSLLEPDVPSRDRSSPSSSEDRVS